jgi:hypothetical protein
MRGRAAAQALILLASACAAAGARAQEAAEAPPDTEHYQLRAEIGMEYDSNAHRVEQISGSDNGVVGSFLQRLVVAGQLTDQVAPRHAVAVTATAAAKIFDAAPARSETVAIAQSSLMWRATIGPRTSLSPSAAYYEAFQSWAPQGDPAGERRDFRSLGPTLELRTGPSERTDLGIAAGYRSLVFKPDRDFDFDGPTAALNLRWLHDADEGADWELRAGGAFEHRRFGGPVQVSSCPPPSQNGLPCAGTATRVDDFVMAQTEVTRTGRLLLSLGYAFQHNGSNSFGETLIRHIATARVATALPLGFYLAARADLLFVSYRDPVPVAQAEMAQGSAARPYASIEEENRSSARVDLSRDVGARVRALLRYTFYANELGNNIGEYRRHTLLLSLSFSFEK